MLACESKSFRFPRTIHIMIRCKRVPCIASITKEDTNIQDNGSKPYSSWEKLHLALTIAATTYLYAHSIVSSLNRQSKRIGRLDSKSSTCPHAILDFLRFPIFEQPFAALVKQSEQIGRLNSKSSTGPYACGKTSWVPSFEQPIAAALIKQSK